MIASCSSKFGSAQCGSFSGSASIGLRADMDALIDAAGVELDRPKRIALTSEALNIIKREHLFIPLHNQPMAWAIRGNVATMVQASDNKPRLWLTKMN